MKHLPLLILSLILTPICFAQKISGFIQDENGMALPYSSVTLRGTSKGVSANNKAMYSFSLKPGKYILVCQHIGYTTVEKEIELNDDIQVDFILKRQQLDMGEVVIKSGDNPANAVIREAIKRRTYYNEQVKGFTCDLYEKDIIRLRNLPDKIFGQKVPDEDKKVMGLDTTGSGIIYLTESVSKVYSQQPDKFKLEVKSSRLSGSNSFGFSFPTFISLYTNNVSVFKNGFSSRGYISPIADGALHYYKFKMLGTFEENGKMVNSIRVTPKRKYEPLFSGIINITDGDWRIHSFDLTLTKESQLEVIDTLRITQLHVPVGDDIWRSKNQLLHFNVKMFSIDAGGDFLSVYSDYEINPAFDKKIFDKVVIKYDTAVNKKKLEYWDTIRPVPLEKDEANDYRIKDSLFKIRQDSSYWANNIDSLKKRQGKLKPYEVIYSGINRTHYSKTNPYSWGVGALIYNTGYNLAEGLVVEMVGNYDRKFNHNKIKLTLNPNLRYGFSNTHLNAWADAEIRFSKNSNDQLNRDVWRVSGGKAVMQYNSDNPVSPLVNSITTLMYGRNEMKTYEKEYLTLYYSKKYESGIKFSLRAEYANRMPLFNTSHFTFRKKDSVNITENYPVEKVTVNDIQQNQAFQLGFRMSVKPGQRFIQFPNQKVAIGSNYPTFTFTYIKAIPGFLGSDADFDKWSLEINDDRNLKLAGLLKYNFTLGGFLNNRRVFIQDYKHFNSNAVRATSSYVNGYQLLNSYAYSNTAKLVCEVHLEHHFNGMITNKIPFLKQWKWNLVVGTNSYYIRKKENYVEYFVGLENILKIFRFDFVSGYMNGKYHNSSLVLGTGGLLGDSINKTSAGGKSISLTF